MKVKSESEVARPTLHDPMDCSLSVSPVRGIFQARVLEWGAIAFSKRSTKGQSLGGSRWGGYVKSPALHALAIPQDYAVA